MNINGMSHRANLLAAGSSQKGGFPLPSKAEMVIADPEPSQPVETQLARSMLQRIRGGLIRGAEALPRSQDAAAAMRVLENRGLAESFLNDVRRQLEQSGKIRIGIIDGFKAEEASHGETVARRLIASAPEYLRDRIEIIRYDVSGGREGSAFANAAQAARNGDIVALSVSGGLRPISVDGLRRDLAPAGLDSPQAFWLALQRFKDEPDYAERELNMQNLSLAGRRIPVVTPVWNEGFTTEAALLSGTIVTSIKKKFGTKRTEAPELVEIEINPLPGSGHTSQSAPIFIGTLLHGITEREVNSLLKK